MRRPLAAGQKASRVDIPAGVRAGQAGAFESGHDTLTRQLDRGPLPARLRGTALRINTPAPLPRLSLAFFTALSDGSERLCVYRWTQAFESSLFTDTLDRFTILHTETPIDDPSIMTEDTSDLQSLISGLDAHIRCGLLLLNDVSCSQRSTTRAQLRQWVYQARSNILTRSALSLPQATRLTQHTFGPETPEGRLLRLWRSSLKDADTVVSLLLALRADAQKDRRHKPLLSPYARHRRRL